MYTELFRKLTGTKTASILLGFVVLGMFAEFAHQAEHDLADQTERCATCVHLDQPAQPGAATALLLSSAFPTAFIPRSAHRPVERRPASPFNSRAPPA